MKLTTQCLIYIVALLLTEMTSCRNEEPASSAVGVIRTDNTDPSAPCRITVVNESAEKHCLRLLTDKGKVLLDADVPSRANSRPPVWRMFQADVSGRVLSVTIDGETKDVALRKDTVEVVIHASQPVGVEKTISQFSQRIQWR